MDRGSGIRDQGSGIGDQGMEDGERELFFERKASSTEERVGALNVL
jgi:hypothetical protein